MFKVKLFSLTRHNYSIWLPPPRSSDTCVLILFVWFIQLAADQTTEGSNNVHPCSQKQSVQLGRLHSSCGKFSSSFAEQFLHGFVINN